MKEKKKESLKQLEKIGIIENKLEILQKCEFL